MMSKQTLVMKFGGTSVGSADALVKATQIIKDARDEYPRVVVITSAMAGVTNLLLDSASLAARGTVDSLSDAESTLREKHFAAADALIKDEKLREATKQEINTLILSLVDLCKAITVLGEASPRTLDAVASIGERMCVRLLGAVLVSAGVKSKAIESTEFIVTNAHYQNAHPDFKITTEKTRAILNPLMEQGIIPITTGFIGATPEGVITTLGRGGSDYSGAIVGAALDADEVAIYTDVDGVMTTDPRLTADARVIPVISYAEMGELAYFGAKVLHPRTIRPVVERQIPLRIRNTFNPTHAGTLVVDQAEPSSRAIKAVTSIKGMSMITVEGRGMIGVPGVAARTFGAVASVGANVLMISQASSSSRTRIKQPNSQRLWIVSSQRESWATCCGYRPG
jgi:aspartate kinase